MNAAPLNHRIPAPLLGALALGALTLTSPAALASPPCNHRVSVPGQVYQRTVLPRVTDRANTVAIAGLLEDKSGTGENAVPALNKTPFLGKLFRSRKNSEKRNLPVLVTPRIVHTNE